MRTALDIIGACLYGLIGVVSMMMAYQCLSADRLMPFHESASGADWDGLSDGVQQVILALLRQSGLGFLAAGMSLFVSAATVVASEDALAVFAPPVLALVFCSGLFVVNRKLTAATGVQARARESLIASLVIVAGLVLVLVAKLAA